MHHYIDIQLRPDPDVPSHHLMSALFAKLHRVLALVQANTIAVCFPGYQTHPAKLGNTLRLVGTEGDLVRLMEHEWLGGMRDHTNAAPVAPVPATAVHRHLQRVQSKSSPERLRRRQMQRHGLTEEQAHETVPDAAAEMLRLPFITLASASTGQHFRLFLRMSPAVSTAQTGEFNTYGLSSTATIPWF